MTTGESVSGEKGQKELQRSEVPFAHSLQEITGEIFIGLGDEEIDRARKQAGGFFVIEEKSADIERKAELLRNGAEGSILNWVENPTHFRSLVGLVATNNSVLDQANRTELQLRMFLYSGSEAEASACRVYIAKDQILGEQAYKATSMPVAYSVQEAKRRIEGLEEFQRRLLERAPIAR